MREILFRGKRIDNGEWVEGFLVKKIDPLLGSECCFILVQEYDTSCIDGQPTHLQSLMTWYKVIPETVGQYTGLTDKNGKKIFEGDILKFGDKIGYVNYGTGCFSVKIVRPIHLNHNNPAIDIVLNECPNGIEIIGNIHDNPELLKGAENDG